MDDISCEEFYNDSLEDAAEEVKLEEINLELQVAADEQREEEQE